VKSPPRRRALAGLTAAAVTALLAGAGARLARAQAPREIAITLQRFQFTPREIALKAGETVVIALTAVDYAHGFSVPDLGVRADGVPGRVVRVELQPRTPGTLEFLCDNFCGDEHEDMHGRFIVGP